MRRVLICLAILLSHVVIVGCCSTRTCVGPADTRARAMKWFSPSIAPLKTHTGEQLSESIRECVSKAGPEPMNVLILSGGGQNGAFGAGFLNGLAARTEKPDLQFDIVTGISTGALQATHAFLGPEYYERLKQAYTTVSKEDIYRDRFILDLICASSIKDTAPLRSLVEEFITMDILHQVAQAHEAGRRLYIGTVNVDTGEFVPWNMGEIATKHNQEALRLYHDILMASASIPLLFPPVLIRQVTSSGAASETLHTDGGTRETVFFRQFMVEFINAVQKAMREAGPYGAIARLDEAAMTVIVNGKIGLGYECTQERWASVGIRSLSALMDQSTVNAVFRAYALGCSNGISFRMVRIPDDTEIDSHSWEFDTDTMRRLFNLGFDMAQSDPIPWETKPPTAEDIDSLCR